MPWCSPCRWVNPPRARDVLRCRLVSRSEARWPANRRSRRPSRQAPQAGRIREADPVRWRRRSDPAYRCSRQRCRETPQWRSNRPANRWFLCWTPQGQRNRRNSGPLLPGLAQRRDRRTWEEWSARDQSRYRCQRARAPFHRCPRSGNSPRPHDRRHRPNPKLRRACVPILRFQGRSGPSLPDAHPRWLPMRTTPRGSRLPRHLQEPRRPNRRGHRRRNRPWPSRDQTYLSH